MIVIVFGLPGSGKSYFAERLAKKINADYVNSDRLRKEMFPKRTYSAEEKAAVYNAMLQKMSVAAKQNQNIVLDATFHKQKTRKAFIDGIRGQDKVYFIEIKAAENLIRQRLKKERADSEADYEVYKLLLQEWEPMNEAHLSLHSTDENISSLLQDAVKYLQKLQ
jgi:predicted kinase